MKTYEERLPLIDEAIVELSGDFQKEYNNPCLLQWRRSGKYCTGTNDYNSGETLFVCTRQEFEQRKAELAAKEQDMSDWYEKGELPPVGDTVEFKYHDQNWDGRTCKVIAIHGRKAWLHLDGNELSNLYEIKNMNFRPLRTEYQAVKAGILDIIEANGNLSNGILADTLVEAGYRKIKLMSEDEFKQKAKLLGCTSDYLLGKLYRAGARFLDQGETND